MRTPMLSLPARRAGAVLAFVALIPLGVLSVVGCADGTRSVAPNPSANNDSTLYWSLTLTRSAILMAKSDTLQLEAVPRNARGEPLTNAAPVTYTSSNLQIVYVDRTGLLLAQRTGASVKVAASMTIDGVTHVDTAMINVVAARPALPLDSLSIQPINTSTVQDSAKVGAGATKNMPARVLDHAGVAIPNAVVRYRSSNPAIVAPLSGPFTSNLLAQVPGIVWLQVEATVFGVTKKDSVRFQVGRPTALTYTLSVEQAPAGQPPIYVYPPAAPFALELGVGASVTWMNTTYNIPTDIVFDHPEGVKSDPTANPFQTSDGDIAAFAFDPTLTTVVNLAYLMRLNRTGFRVRRFPTPGTYKFHSTLVPSIQGIIRIIDDRTAAQ